MEQRGMYASLMRTTNSKTFALESAALRVELCRAILAQAQWQRRLERGLNGVYEVTAEVELPTGEPEKTTATPVFLAVRQIGARMGFQACLYVESINAPPLLESLAHPGKTEDEVRKLRFELQKTAEMVFGVDLEAMEMEFFPPYKQQTSNWFFAFSDWVVGRVWSLIHRK